MISPDLNSAGLRPARAGGKEGQPGGAVTPGSPPSRPGRLNRGVGIARRGWPPPPPPGPPSSVRGGDTAPLGLKHQHQLSRHSNISFISSLSYLVGEETERSWSISEESLRRLL